MMRFLLFILLFSFPLFGEILFINNFKTDLFSKNINNLRKIKVDLVFDTNSTINQYKLKDALNIVISSFFIEDLFTSQGKENFKTLLRDYLKEKEKIIINNIYLQNMQIIDEVSIKELMQKIKELKKEK